MGGSVPVGGGWIKGRKEEAEEFWGLNLFILISIIGYQNESAQHGYPPVYVSVVVRERIYLWNNESAEQEKQQKQEHEQ